MPKFTGEYEATLDVKGRFLLPAGLKKMMPEGTTTLVLNRGADNCLNMYLEDDWKKVEERLSQVNPYDSAQNRMVRRMLIAGAIHIDMDAAGRLNIPKKLCEFAGLEKDILLTGDLEKVEIWDKAKYEMLMGGITPEMLTNMSASVLGSGAIKQGEV